MKAPLSDELRAILDDPAASEQLEKIMHQNGSHGARIEYKGQTYIVKTVYRNGNPSLWRDFKKWVKKLFGAL